MSRLDPFKKRVLSSICYRFVTDLYTKESVRCIVGAGMFESDRVILPLKVLDLSSSTCYRFVIDLSWPFYGMSQACLANTPNILNISLTDVTSYTFCIPLKVLEKELNLTLSKKVKWPDKGPLYFLWFFGHSNKSKICQCKM